MSRLRSRGCEHVDLDHHAVVIEVRHLDRHDDCLRVAFPDHRERGCAIAGCVFREVDVEFADLSLIEPATRNHAFDHLTDKPRLRHKVVWSDDISLAVERTLAACPAKIAVAHQRGDTDVFLHGKDIKWHVKPSAHPYPSVWFEDTVFGR